MQCVCKKMEKTIVFLIGLSITLTGCLNQTQEQAASTQIDDAGQEPAQQVSQRQMQGRNRSMDRSRLEGSVEACDGKTEGDDCELTRNNDTVSGTCRARRTGDLLTCMPSNIDFSQRPGNRTGLPGQRPSPRPGMPAEAG
jgi:hypothetical protein